MQRSGRRAVARASDASDATRSVTSSTRKGELPRESTYMNIHDSSHTTRFDSLTRRSFPPPTARRAARTEPRRRRLGVRRAAARRPAQPGLGRAFGQTAPQRDERLRVQREAVTETVAGEHDEGAPVEYHRAAAEKLDVLRGGGAAQRARARPRRARRRRRQRRRAKSLLGTREPASMSASVASSAPLRRSACPNLDHRAHDTVARAEYAEEACDLRAAC